MGDFISFIHSYMKLVFTKYLLVNIYWGPSVVLVPKYVSNSKICVLHTASHRSFIGL